MAPPLLEMRNVSRAEKPSLVPMRGSLSSAPKYSEMAPSLSDNSSSLRPSLEAASASTFSMDTPTTCTPFFANSLESSSNRSASAEHPGVSDFWKKKTTLAFFAGTFVLPPFEDGRLKLFARVPTSMPASSRRGDGRQSNFTRRPPPGAPRPARLPRHADRVHWEARAAGGGGGGAKVPARGPAMLPRRAPAAPRRETRIA